MVRAVFQGDVFLIQQNQMKVDVAIQSKEFKADVRALLDSGATKNCISQTVVNRFKLQKIKLSKAKYVRNIDGTRNSIGSITHKVDLRLQYNNYNQVQEFLIINMGSDEMLLGYPFLEATNPTIDWRKKKLHGRIRLTTKDSNQWTPQRQQRNTDNQQMMQQNDDPYCYARTVAYLGSLKGMSQDTKAFIERVD